MSAKFVCGFDDGYFRISLFDRETPGRKFYVTLNVGRSCYLYAERNSGRWHKAWRLWKARKP
jgi:hypothetical protein